MISFGSEQTIVAGGKSYTLDRLRIKHIRAFRDWIAVQIGDPFAEAERFVDRLPAAEATALIQRGREIRDQLQSFSILSPLGQRFLLTEAGLLFVTGQMLQLHHPDLEEEERLEIADVLAGRICETLMTAMGSVPNAGGPAAEAPPAPSTGGSCTGGSSSAGQG